jgi:D-lactate dehydrogenase (cytochrome)
MNKVLEVNAEDLDCTVEPGVTREQLNSYLRDTGLFFPIDPGANASIGGMTATRASGTNAVRYGTMRDNVIAVTAVTASGEEIRTARRARKSSAGYDLTRLFVGSEGTLGVITSVTLRLQGIPQAISGGVCPFPDRRGSLQRGHHDHPDGHSGRPDRTSGCAADEGLQRLLRSLSYPEGPTLFLEFHGTDAGVAEQAELFGEIAAECGGGEFLWTTRIPNGAPNCGRPATMPIGRRCNCRPGAKGVSTDVCVPISQACRMRRRDPGRHRRRGLIAPIVGHAGDGNFPCAHAAWTPMFPPRSSRAEAFVGRLNARALAMDGTCTGEHGIGQGKQPYLSLEMGEGVSVMRQIKQALDPMNIMNPGKIFSFES